MAGRRWSNHTGWHAKLSGITLGAMVKHGKWCVSRGGGTECTASGAPHSAFSRRTAGAPSHPLAGPLSPTASRPASSWLPAFSTAARPTGLLRVRSAALPDGTPFRFSQQEEKQREKK
eukprot:GGOE01018112.1.p2 GENE.GGOE01018112.1~~GGOE01018112.1.p2  ORF type:complete len:118 (+),score=4.21 GGOE01018112.1:255-608(+)